MFNFKRLNLSIKVLGGLIFIGLITSLIWILVFKPPMSQKQKEVGKNTSIILSQPDTKSQLSIEEAFLKRRSVREYKDEPLTLKEISQILWAAQGITSARGGRTAPSAGALYPLEVYLAVRKAEDIEPGVYRYLSEGHKLDRILEDDVSGKLAQAALSQMFIKEAPINLIFSGIFSRTTKKYGERGIRYVYMEAGHAAQNVYLQVQSLGLGTVTVGAFDDEEVKQILNLSEDETPLYIIPIGKIGF